MFESWGYDITDSIWLQKELTRQAQEIYANGDYTLGNLDQYGQRISIIIVLPRKDKAGIVRFLSGWMVYPNGVIVNTTPLGGKLNERI